MWKVCEGRSFSYSFVFVLLTSGVDVRICVLRDVGCVCSRTKRGGKVGDDGEREVRLRWASCQEGQGTDKSEVIGKTGIHVHFVGRKA